MPIRHIHNCGYVAVRSHELPPAGPADHLAINEDRSSSNDRSCDPPDKFAAEIGADATASLQGVRVERPPSLGIYNREVSVGTDGDRPFARIQTEELGGTRGGEMRDALE